MTHELLIDSLFKGPGLRMVCSCGKWARQGAMPWTLLEAEHHASFERHRAASRSFDAPYRGQERARPEPNPLPPLPDPFVE